MAVWMNLGLGILFGDSRELIKYFKVGDTLSKIM